MQVLKAMLASDPEERVDVHGALLMHELDMHELDMVEATIHDAGKLHQLQQPLSAEVLKGLNSIRLKEKTAVQAWLPT